MDPLTPTLPQGIVTLLLTDIEGSTDLATRRGDAVAREALRAHEHVLSREIKKHGGIHVKGLGDGALVAFPTARGAIACAISLQRALAEENRRNIREPLRVRIGINAGEVVEESGDLFGAAVNAAVRIVARATGGQILVAEVVKQLCGASTDVQFKDRGRFRLKGFAERWRLYEVPWRDESESPKGALHERTRFVGREAERAQLMQLLDRPLARRGALVLVGGEAGVGKTRLAEEMAIEGARRGIQTHIGRCYEMEGSPPYTPFLEILETVLAQVGDLEGFRELLGNDASEVARIVPKIRRSFPDIPAPLDLPPEQERRYLFDSMREFILRAAEARPQLLILDDLQWADEPTLLLLSHVAQRLDDMPVLIVGTYRDVELEVGRPAARALGDLLRQRLAVRIPLKPLGREGVVAMLRALADQEPPQGLVDAIAAETDGNPFFVEEVYKNLAEEGKLFDAEGRFTADPDIDELDVPESVRLVVGRRLARLGEPGRKVLAAAAVIGRDFSFRLLAELAEVGPDTLLDVVDEAERAHLILSLANGSDARFTFSHELIRQTLVSGLSLPRRQRLHLRAADALERVHGAAVVEHAPELAHHLYQAGDVADAARVARFLLLTGDQAMTAAAFEDALRHYERAQSLRFDADELRGDVSRKLGFAHRSLGQWDDAIACWEEALAAYERAGATEPAGRLCRDVSQQLAWAGRYPESLQTVGRGLDILGNVNNQDRCRLLASAAAAYSLSGVHDAAAKMLEDAFVMARELGDEDALATIRQSEALYHLAFGRNELTVEIGAEVADRMRVSARQWDLGNHLTFVQAAHASLGQFEAVEAIAAELEPMAQKLGHIGAVVISGRNRALASLATTGDLEGFGTLVDTLLDQLDAVGGAFGAPNFSSLVTMQGCKLLWTGDWETALERFTEAAAVEPPFALGGQRIFVPMCQAYLGMREDALAGIEANRGAFPVVGRANTQTAWTLLLGAVETLAMLGEWEKTAELAPLAEEAASRATLVRSFDGRLVSTMAAVAAAAAGREEAAERHFEVAVGLAEKVPMRLELPAARRLFAQAIAHRGGSGARERAGTLLLEAAEEYGRLGMARHADLARSLAG